MVQLYLSEIIDSQDQEKFEKIYRHYEQKMFSVAYGGGGGHPVQVWT